MQYDAVLKQLSELFQCHYEWKGLVPTQYLRSSRRRCFSKMTKLLRVVEMWFLLHYGLLSLAKFVYQHDKKSRLD